jgi:predicted nuclease with TOPRIM domain
MKKLDKKDKKIKELKEEVGSLERSLSYKQSKIDELTGELKSVKDKWNEYKQRIEGRELPALEENRWLKETLRLVVVSSDKFEEIDRLNKQNNMVGRY